MPKERCIICGESIIKRAPKHASICKCCHRRNMKMAVKNKWYIDSDVPEI